MRRFTPLFAVLLLAIPAPARQNRPPSVFTDRTVLLVGALPEADLIALTTAHAAAGGTPGVLLLDTPAARPHLPAFLRRFHADRVVTVGGLPDADPRLDVPVASRSGSYADALTLLFPKPERVVVVPAAPREQLLRAAALAGAVGAPLVPLHDAAGLAALRQRLEAAQPKELLLVGTAIQSAGDLPAETRTEFPDAASMAARRLDELTRRGPVKTLVTVNPSPEQDRAGLASLGPWLATQRRAALLFADVTNAGDVIRAALKVPALAGAENLVLLGGHDALPVEKRPNPVPGKDAVIEMEPATPGDDEPYSLATGRLFHADRGIVALVLARNRLLEGAPPGPRQALVASNPGGSLPLLETFSRNTARELKNAGYTTTALFGHELNRFELRQQVSHQDIFLWEGHYKTLKEEYGLPTWTEPLPPALIFLQSCLALNEAEALPLLERGAVAIVGSSTRTYSGTGGAFSLGFFDGLLYEDQSLGGALRQGKNFLLCYSRLKKKRLGDKARLEGVNVRSAWAFTLWGDPALKLPSPPKPADAQPAVSHRVAKDTLTLLLPEKQYDPIQRPPYRAEMWPNTRMAGLLSREVGEDDKRLVPFLFAEVNLTPPRPGALPRLSGRLNSSRWEFAWDARRHCGYLLAMPHADDREVRFKVNWE